MPNHKPVWYLPTAIATPRLLLLSIASTTDLVGHNRASSPLSSTATNSLTPKGLAWRLNNSAFNSTNVVSVPAKTRLWLVRPCGRYCTQAPTIRAPDPPHLFTPWPGGYSILYRFDWIRNRQYRQLRRLCCETLICSVFALPEPLLSIRYCILFCRSAVTTACSTAAVPSETPVPLANR